MVCMYDCTMSYVSMDTCMHVCRYERMHYMRACMPPQPAAAATAMVVTVISVPAVEWSAVAQW